MAGGFVLSGTNLFVPDAHLSDALVVAVRTERRQHDGQRRQPVPGDEGHSRPHRHLTRKHDLQLYFERSKASEVAFDDTIWHRERAVRLLTA